VSLDATASSNATGNGREIHTCGMAVSPDFHLWPPKRHRAVLWILAHLVVYRTKQDWSLTVWISWGVRSGKSITCPTGPLLWAATSGFWNCDIESKSVQRYPLQLFKTGSFPIPRHVEKVPCSFNIVQNNCLHFPIGVISYLSRIWKW
jgi:hypothetical protein